MRSQAKATAEGPVQVDRSDHGTIGNFEYVDIDSCTVPELNPGSPQFRIPVTVCGRNRSIEVAVMIDSGATSVFVNRQFVEKHNVVTHKLFKPIAVRNVDGTSNKAGYIEDWCRLRLQSGTYEEVVDFLITDLGSEDMILGLPWLRKVNSTIDWESGEVTIGATALDESSPCGRVDTSRRQRRKLVKNGILEHATEELWCNASYTYSTELAAKAKGKETQRSLEEMIPEPYRDFAKVFSEQESERLPQHQSWDHPIDLKPDAPETLRSKVYPMPVNEQSELDRFLEESLRKGYIIPSKSPMASPVSGNAVAAQASWHFMP